MRFESFDPYESVFAPDREPAFRDRSGNLIPVHGVPSERLLALVVAISLYFMRPMRRDQWDMILEGMDGLADLMRKQMTELDAVDGIFYRGKGQGEPAPNWKHVPFANVVESTYGAFTSIAREKPPDPGEFVVAFGGALCIASIVKIDDVFTAMRIDDASLGVTAALAAASMFADAKRMLDARTTPLQPLSASTQRLGASEIGRLGAIAREKQYAGPRQYVREQWALHRDAYANNKSDFARHYVTLVLRTYGTVVTEKTIRESWLKDTPPTA